MKRFVAEKPCDTYYRKIEFRLNQKNRIEGRLCAQNPFSDTKTEIEWLLRNIVAVSMFGTQQTIITSSATRNDSSLFQTLKLALDGHHPTFCKINWPDIVSENGTQYIDQCEMTLIEGSLFNNTLVLHFKRNDGPPLPLQKDLMEICTEEYFATLTKEEKKSLLDSLPTRLNEMEKEKQQEFVQFLTKQLMK